MLGGFDIKIDGTSYRIKIIEKGMFKEKIEKTKIAICTKYRKISLYT